MTIVSDALAALDAGRALLDDAGLCPYQVFVRERTWSGQRTGLANATFVDEDTELTVADGRRPQVQQVQQQALVAPGSPIQRARFEVGPLTPSYEGGGVATSTIQPSGNTTKELFFVVFGPGLPDTGLLCRQVGLDASSPFRITITIEAMGQAA